MAIFFIMKTIITLFICFAILFINNATAQINKIYIETGISANSYKGSLNQGFGNYTSSYHLGVRFCKKQRFNGRVNISYGHIDGQTPSFIVKDYKGNFVYPANYFNTSILTFNYELNFNVVLKKTYSIYIGAGIGVVKFNVKDQDGNELANNASTRDRGEEYSNNSFIAPVLIGFNYILPNDYRLGIQTQLLNPFTDYLDNTSKWSPYVTSDNVLMFKFFVSVPIKLK